MALKLPGQRQIALSAGGILTVLALVAQPLYSTLASQPASAASSIEVTNVTTNGWSATTNDGAGVNFVKDGATGALQLTTASSNDSRVRFTKDVDVALSSVGAITMVSKVVNDGGNAAANVAFRMGLDNDNNGSIDQYVVYEPYYSGMVTSNVWQSWDVSDGYFWGNWNPAGGYDSNKKIDQIPDTTSDTHVRSISVGLGTWNPSWNIFVDSLTFGDVTYDFNKLVPTPANLRLNGDKACGYATNVNYITPTWDAAAGAVSYNYKVTLPNGTTYGPTNVGNITSVSGSFGGEGLSTFSVQAVDASGDTSEWSASCAVTYDATAPDVPTLESPAADATINYNSFWFEWSDAAGASSYEFQASQNSDVDANGSLTVGVWHGDASGTEPTESKAWSSGANGTWYWQVRAVDAAGNKSAWTEPRKLTIDLTSTPTEPTEPTDPTDPGDTGEETPTDTSGPTDNGEVPTTTTNDDSDDPNLLASAQFFTAPQIAAEDRAVLGVRDTDTSDRTTTPLTKSAVVDTDQAVEGVTDTKKSAGDFGWLGFAWYWWLLVLAAVAFLWWLIAAARRARTE